MNFKTQSIIAAMLLMVAFTARTDEISDKGREIFKKQQKAVVTVQLVQKVSYAASGRASEPRESKLDVTGTIVDPSGAQWLPWPLRPPSCTPSRAGSGTASRRRPSPGSGAGSAGWST